MRYTQKDIRNVMGIGRDALRLYEQRGIITPEIDPSNGYRYYDDWQINLLWECKRYQGLGFSLAEIRDILRSDNLESLVNRVQRRHNELSREIERLQAVEKNFSSYLASLEDVPLHAGEVRRVVMPDFAYVPEREVHDLLLEAGESSITRFMNGHTDLTMPICWFPRLDDPTYFWGFGLPAEQYQQMGGPLEGHLPITLPGGPAIVTCIDAGERGGFGRKLFDPLLRAAELDGATPRGMLFGRLLARTHEKDGYHRYVEGVLPVEDAE